jgi:hypothetical protein
MRLSPCFWTCSIHLARSSAAFFSSSSARLRMFSATVFLCCATTRRSQNRAVNDGECELHGARTMDCVRSATSRVGVPPQEALHPLSPTRCLQACPWTWHPAAAAPWAAGCLRPCARLRATRSCWAPATHPLMEEEAAREGSRGPCADAACLVRPGPRGTRPWPRPKQARLQGRPPAANGSAACDAIER